MRAGGFTDHVTELLAPLRACVGYCDGVFLGIVHDGALYLKADTVNRAEFQRAGCEIFTYSRKGKAATLNFYRPPEDAMDAPQRMLPWAKKALEAALRARATPRSRQSQRKTAARSGRR